MSMTEWRWRKTLFASVGAAGLGIAGAGAVRAVQPDEILGDPALEARARGISAELRCLVCQNQSIDDSNAPLARDLRLLVVGSVIVLLDSWLYISIISWMPRRALGAESGHPSRYAVVMVQA